MLAALKNAARHKLEFNSTRESWHLHLLTLCGFLAKKDGSHSHRRDCQFRGVTHPDTKVSALQQFVYSEVLL